MKIFFIIFILIFSSAEIFSQDTTSQKSSEYFIILYTVGENWDTTKQAYEQQYFQDHSTHLSKLRKEKKIEIGGRYSDTGMLLLKAHDESEAKKLVLNDVSVKNKTFKVEIFPINFFFKGCVE